MLGEDPEVLLSPVAEPSKAHFEPLQLEFIIRIEFDAFHPDGWDGMRDEFLSRLLKNRFSDSNLFPP